MRCAPPLQLSVNRFGLWRAGLLLLAACACGSMFAWWWAQPAPSPLWADTTAGVGGLLSMACLAGLWRIRPFTLRWDGQHWFVARIGAPECAGELAVAVDLGSWMLLSFRPEAGHVGAAGLGRSAWIALQRPGLDAQWHALRCGLFAARPAVPSSLVFGNV